MRLVGDDLQRSVQRRPVGPQRGTPTAGPSSVGAVTSPAAPVGAPPTARPEGRPPASGPRPRARSAAPRDGDHVPVSTMDTTSSWVTPLTSSLPDREPDLAEPYRNVVDEEQRLPVDRDAVRHPPLEQLLSVDPRGTFRVEVAPGSFHFGRDGVCHRPAASTSRAKQTGYQGHDRLIHLAIRQAESATTSIDDPADELERVGQPGQGRRLGNQLEHGLDQGNGHQGRGGDLTVDSVEQDDRGDAQVSRGHAETELVRRSLHLAVGLTERQRPGERQDVAVGPDRDGFVGDVAETVTREVHRGGGLAHAGRPDQGHHLTIGVSNAGRMEHEPGAGCGLDGLDRQLTEQRRGPGRSAGSERRSIAMSRGQRPVRRTKARPLLLEESHASRAEAQLTTKVEPRASSCNPFNPMALALGHEAASREAPDPTLAPIRPSWTTSTT